MGCDQRRLARSVGDRPEPRQWELHAARKTVTDSFYTGWFSKGGGIGRPPGSVQADRSLQARSVRGSGRALCD